MRRGDVVWVDFAAATGSEVRKRRPAVIVSNDSANRFLNRVQVVPLSSSVAKVFPSEARVHVAGKDGKAMADQLTTADKSRLGDRLGTLTGAEMSAVEAAIRVQLQL